MPIWESDLPIESVKRYSRQIVVPRIGIVGQRAIGESRVLVVGAGGLGSPVLTYLAMAGVGVLGIADYDHVELHNLQRQSVHSEASIGQRKTESAAEFIKGINSRVVVALHDLKLDAENVSDVIREYDVVVDCCDQVGLRYAINDCCRMQGKDLVSASVLRWEGQVCVVPHTGCCYRCIFPEMKESAPNCDLSGVLGSMCGVIGCMQATEVLKLILGSDGSEATRLMVFDGYNSSHKVFEKKWERCEVCQMANGSVDAVRSDKKECQKKCPKDCESGKDAPGNAPLTWEEALSGKYTIVDVRTPVHFQMFRARGALSIPDARGNIEKIRAIGTPIAVTCYRGVMSAEVAAFLSENGVEAYSIAGGAEGLKKFVGFDRL